MNDLEFAKRVRSAYKKMESSLTDEEFLLMLEHIDTFADMELFDEDEDELYEHGMRFNDKGFFDPYDYNFGSAKAEHKEAPSKEFTYVISVSLGTGCYRHIKISSNALLSELHDEIIEAFEFYDDHAHAFFMDNKMWSYEESFYSNIVEEEENYTDEYKLYEVLEKGKRFKYVFDFGDCWEFQCRVLKTLDEVCDVPQVVRSVGEAPEQYGMDDFDEDFDDDFDE